MPLRDHVWTTIFFRFPNKIFPVSILLFLWQRVHLDLYTYSRSQIYKQIRHILHPFQCYASYYNAQVAVNLFTIRKHEHDAQFFLQLLTIPARKPLYLRTLHLFHYECTRVVQRDNLQHIKRGRHGRQSLQDTGENMKTGAIFEIYFAIYKSGLPIFIFLPTVPGQRKWQIYRTSRAWKQKRLNSLYRGHSRHKHLHAHNMDQPFLQVSIPFLSSINSIMNAMCVKNTMMQYIN